MDNSKIISALKDFAEDNDKWSHGPQFKVGGLHITSSKWRRPEGFIFMIDVSKDGRLILCKCYSYGLDCKKGFYELDHYLFDYSSGLSRVPTEISREKFIDIILMAGDNSKEFVDFVLWSDL